VDLADLVLGLTRAARTGAGGRLNGAARAGGFSLHAGVAIAPGEGARLERLCRYVSRPPVAAERLALTASGQVRYTLKTPCRDGSQSAAEAAGFGGCERCARVGGEPGGVDRAGASQV